MPGEYRATQVSMVRSFIVSRRSLLSRAPRRSPGHCVSALGDVAGRNYINMLRNNLISHSDQEGGDEHVLIATPKTTVGDDRVLGRPSRLSRSRRESRSCLKPITVETWRRCEILAFLRIRQRFSADQWRYRCQPDQHLMPANNSMPVANEKHRHPAPMSCWPGDRHFAHADFVMIGPAATAAAIRTTSVMTAMVAINRRARR